MSSEKPNLLGVKWELGTMSKFKLAEGEAPHFSISVREAGAMPVRVVTKLDFGYGRVSDPDVAEHIVGVHNLHEDLVVVLDQLLYEVVSDNQALACVDLRIIDRAKAALALAAALKEKADKP